MPQLRRTMRTYYVKRSEKTPGDIVSLFLTTGAAYKCHKYRPKNPEGYRLVRAGSPSEAMKLYQTWEINQAAGAILADALLHWGAKSCARGDMKPGAFFRLAKGVCK